MWYVSGFRLWGRGLPEIHGSCDERLARVRDAFERNFTELGDLGASFAMTVEGEFVADIWAGHRDAAATEPWVEDTIVNVYVCFWGGYGGSLVVCDLDARIAFSYVMNRMDAGILGDERGFGLWNAVYESLEA